MRRSSSLLALLGSTLLLFWMLACGSSSNSSSTTSGMGTSSGTSGSFNSGNSSSNGGSGSNGSSTSGAMFVYSGVAVNSGGIAGFKLDPSTGNLTQVAGSPVTFSGQAGLGPVAATNGNVYGANIDSGNNGTLFQYKADPNSGSLTPVGTTSAGGANGFVQQKQLYVAPSGKALYSATQETLASLSLNNGTPNLLGTITVTNGSIWGFGVMPSGPHAYVAVQDGNPKTGFGIPRIELLNVASNGNLTDSGKAVASMLSNFAAQNGLAVDPTGHFVIATNGPSANELSVFKINSDGSLTEVANSPFKTNAVGSLAFPSFDSSGQFLYLVDNSLATPNPVNIEVWRLDSVSGALTPVQTLSLPSGFNATWLKVTDAYAFLTAQGNGSPISTITVMKRDSASGQLNVASTFTTPTDEILGQTDTLQF